MKIDPDDSAFPVPGLSGLPNGQWVDPTQGMNIRTVMAMHFMTAYISRDNTELSCKWAVADADALSAELNK